MAVIVASQLGYREFESDVVNRIRGSTHASDCRVLGESNLICQ